MSLAPALLLETYAIPRQTQTAGTAIVAGVPPMRGRRTKIDFLQLTSGATAHTWYFQRELGRAPLAVAAAGGATSLVLTRDPGSFSTDPAFSTRGVTPSTANNLVAANDYFILMLADGTMQVSKASAVATDSSTGRVTLTVPAIGNAGAPAGTLVYFMGITTDTSPFTNIANPSLTPGTSATTVYPNAAAVGGATLIDSVQSNSPILIFNANATAASSLDLGSAVYQQTGP